MTDCRLNFENLEGWVQVDGQDTKLYGVVSDNSKKEVSCWIASAADKSFSVAVQKLDSAYDCGCYVYLDGSRASNILLPKEFMNIPQICREVYISDTTARPYKFFPVALTDDDRFLEGSASTRDVGEIKLAIYRLSRPVPKVHGAPQAFYCPPEERRVHERSKKAIAHQVHYGEEVTRQQPPISLARPIERLVTFIFKYRNLEMLQANDIAPRDPLPPRIHSDASSLETTNGKRKISEVKVESETEKEGDYSEDEDIARLRAEVERLQEAKRAKREAQRPKKKLKQEVQLFSVPGEVIDLT
ncbi:hypothetical protein B0H34DRAFT_732773 [Crassisporium funariophilum]|nr:hypothetical protein B0H34DRAFT_732773 [Crassisporium funariophilum]